MAWYPQLSFSPMVTVSRKSVVEDRSVNTTFPIQEPPRLVDLDVAYWPRLCEKATTPDCDRRSYLFKTAVGAHTARPFNFEAELKNIILVAPRACVFSHSLGLSRHIAPRHQLGCYQSIAEVDGQSSVEEGDAFDPSRKSNSQTFD